MSYNRGIQIPGIGTKLFQLSKSLNPVESVITKIENFFYLCIHTQGYGSFRISLQAAPTPGVYVNVFKREYLIPYKGTFDFNANTFALIPNLTNL